MKKSAIPDPFEEAREAKGYGEMNDQNDPVTMILGLKEVRKCAHNWQKFQSGAQPGRIVIPSEVSIRETRQIPFEVDPPAHKSYRNLLEVWFKRPLEKGYVKRLEKIIYDSIDEAISKKSLDVVNDFSLKIQSQALTLLLNVPMETSKTWIEWGTHVFRSEGTSLDGQKAAILYDYIDHQITLAMEEPSDSLYSKLIETQLDGKKLTREEIKGILILTFAGGRDTLINTITNTIAYFAEHPEQLKYIKNNPEIKKKAVEELIRYFAPLTHMGRVTTSDSEVSNCEIKANSRISLCWASANRDASVFENPNEVILDRKINPHVSFGFGVHNCLGATHARQLLYTLISVLSIKINSIKILNYEENIENLGEFKRKVGFNTLEVKFMA